MTEVTTTRVAPESNPEGAADNAAFERRVEDIRNHPDWSDEAKKRFLSEAFEEAMEKHDQLIAEGKRVEEEKISTRQSYRDASFRVLDALDKVAVGDRQRVLSDLMESLRKSSWRSPATTPPSSGVTGTSPTPTGPSILRPPSCDGHAFGGHRDPGAGAEAALG